MQYYSRYFTSLRGGFGVSGPKKYFVPVSDLIRIASCTAFCGSRKLRKKWKFANLFRSFPHVRSLWEQKVAQKVWKLSLCTVSRDLEQKIANFLRCKYGRGKLHGGNNTSSGSGRKHELLFSRVTQPLHNHTREPHTTHTTPNVDMDNEIESIDNQSEEVAVAASAAAASIMMGLIEQEAEDEDCAGAHGEGEEEEEKEPVLPAA